MIEGLIDIFIGTRCVKAGAEVFPRIADVMMKNGVRYKNVKKSNDFVEFTLTEWQYKRLDRLLSEEVTTVYRRGIPSLIYRYRGRPGVIIGLLTLLVLTRLSTLYVWDVSVEGNGDISDSEVLTTLEKLGFGVGSYIPSVDYYGICHRFVLEDERIAWISINMEGTRARVEVIEGEQKGTPELGNGTPSNIVADVGGIIYRTETVSGETMVKPGDRVEEGQLLVSGVVEVGPKDSGRYTLMRSQGKVFAYTNRTFSIEIPLSGVRKETDGRILVKKTLKFFGKSINIYKNSSILLDSCDIIEENRRIVLFEDLGESVSLPLPLSVSCQYAFTEKEISFELSEDEALSAAEDQAERMIAQVLDDGELLSKSADYFISDGVLIYTVQIECIENIAREAPIGLV